ncbi:MAG TPA: hypothetical protein VGD49_12470 [Longimicrobiales bacterium]
MENRWHKLQMPLTTLIAIVAIGLAAWEGLENRKHNRLEVAPRVNGSIQLSRDGAAIVLQSNGLGPAVLQDFRIYLDGRVVHDARADTSAVSPWPQLMTQLKIDRYTVSGNAYTSGSLLRAGEDYEIFTIAPTDSTTRAQAEEEMFAVMNRIAVEVCYCSIYEDQCRTVFVGLREAPGARDGPQSECRRR